MTRDEREGRKAMKGLLVGLAITVLAVWAPTASWLVTR